jgi:hypothetical protein
MRCLRAHVCCIKPNFLLEPVFLLLCSVGTKVRPEGRQKIVGEADSGGAGWDQTMVPIATNSAARTHGEKHTLISVLIVTVLVAAVYATLFCNYRVNTNIDIPWYLSFSYNYCMKGIDTDVTFGVPFPVGQDGTVAFGKLAAIVQCAVLAPFNWSLVAANVLSVAGVVLSMAAIFVFLVGQGFSRFGAITCCLALAATEPFVAMANQPRYEYVTFLLAVCGLLLAARGQLFLAGLTSVLAIEVQPIGIMAPIYLIAYELSRMAQTGRYRLEFDRAVKMVLGGVLGLAVYFILHPHILALLAAASNSGGWDKGAIHFLYEYFFEARLYRHLPELAVFIACVLVHIWRRDYMQWPFPIIASFATFFIGFFLHHHNYYYTPFWYFPSFLLVFLTISVAWRAVTLPVLVLVLFVPQYAVAYVWAHKYAGQGELQVARSVIASRGTDLSRAHIFGDFLFWPVFKDLSFEWSPTGKFNQPGGTSYLICGLDPPFIPEENVCADELPAFGDMQLVGQFSWASRKYLVYGRRESKDNKEDLTKTN